jgi:hypothetical protein
MAQIISSIGQEYWVSGLLPFITKECSVSESECVSTLRWKGELSHTQIWNRMWDMYNPETQ